MKFYVGDEDLGMVIESYYRYEERLYIRYLDVLWLLFMILMEIMKKCYQNRMIRQITK